jgi:hypothetical protein
VLHGASLRFEVLLPSARFSRKFPSLFPNPDDISLRPLPNLSLIPPVAHLEFRSRSCRLDQFVADLRAGCHFLKPASHKGPVYSEDAHSRGGLRFGDDPLLAHDCQHWPERENRQEAHLLSGFWLRN